MPSLGKIVVTTVNDQGQGVFEDDLTVQPTALPGNANIRRIFTADKVPLPGIKYDNTHAVNDIANKEGAEFILTEMPPGTISPMHATLSVDFGVVLSGEITLIVDSGEEKVLRYENLLVACF